MLLLTLLLLRLHVTKLLQLLRDLIPCFWFSHFYILVYQVLWNLPHILPMKSSVHSVRCASCISQPIQREKRMISQDPGNPCWLWQITDSLANCSKSFHLITYLKMDPRSMSISTWLVACEAVFSPLLVRNMLLFFSFSYLPSSARFHKDGREWFYDFTLKFS